VKDDVNPFAINHILTASISLWALNNYASIPLFLDCS